METGVLSDNDIPEIDVSHLPQEFSSAARMPVPDERSALLGNAARRRAGDTVRIVDENFERVGDEYDNDNDDDDDDLPQETSEYVLHEIIDETKPYPRTAMLHLMLCCVRRCTHVFVVTQRQTLCLIALTHTTAQPTRSVVCNGVCVFGRQRYFASLLVRLFRRQGIVCCCVDGDLDYCHSRYSQQCVCVCVL
jgi:hypothetical protein